MFFSSDEDEEEPELCVLVLAFFPFSGSASESELSEPDEEEEDDEEEEEDEEDELLLSSFFSFVLSDGFSCFPFTSLRPPAACEDRLARAFWSSVRLSGSGGGVFLWSAGF